MSLVFTLVNNIDVIKYCKNLTNINLNYTYINDLTPLSCCKNIKEIELSELPINNINPLNNCNNIEKADTALLQDGCERGPSKEGHYPYRDESLT